jgi:hypothetical protein
VKKQLLISIMQVRQHLYLSVVRGMTSICGACATLTPVLEYLVTEPPLKKRWDATLCRTSSQGHAKHGPLGSVALPHRVKMGAAPICLTD